MDGTDLLVKGRARPARAPWGVLGAPGLCVLSVAAAIACTTSTGDGSEGGTGTGSGGRVAGGESSGGSGAPQGGTGGSPGTAGGIGNTAATAGTTTGAPATGGVGSVSVGGYSTGGVATGGREGAETGGVGTGSVGEGASNTGVGSGGRGSGGRSVGTGGGGGAGTGGAGTGGSATGGVADTVARTTSTYEFRHFPIQTSSDGVWNGPSTPGTQVASTTYNTVVLENGYLRVTLLPSYGGRVLSIVHKPTNREFLYQNPIGTPYLMLEGIFYYDYLVVMGGIFPSFPEPEHGKYWNQPYDLEVVSESKDAITLRMSRKDDLDVASGVPAKYDVGRTDVLVELDVTLRAGSTSLELGTKLTNTQSKPIPRFEYWTNTTLAPGSTPGKSAIPLNTRILAVMDEVHLLESSWSWFARAEERVSGEVFKWNNLAYFKNWADEGIAYASPDYGADWSGLMNDDTSMGIVCASENVQTPGLKLWTFGRDSVNADINDSTQWYRPTIEMWHGVTPEFWIRGALSANEVRQWTDSYFPTLGLKDITAASAYGALYLSSSKSGTDTTLNVAAALTLPNQTVKAILRLNGSAVAEQAVVVAAAEATGMSATVASGQISPGAVFQAEFLQGDTSLLSGQITLQ
ncbi:MAG: DUF5107 domain-containing protein [Polyangiaceae bacterium]|nr:DUF5107 domain-containing protein [Polyangiaceae bacterium]